MAALSTRVTELKKRGKRVMLVGDFNTVRGPSDAFDWKQQPEREKMQGLATWEREEFENLIVTHGFHDMLEVNARRAPSDNYTWFPQQLRNARKHRHGRRLDYVL